MPTLTGKPWGVSPPRGERMISEHFSWAEAVCKCGCGKVASVAAVRNTAQWLEKLRAHFGNRPLVISSFTRCPRHNRNVGGATQSMHLKSWAVDFNIKGLTPQQVQEELLSTQPYFARGIGSYHSWTHADRGPVRSWEGP